MKTLTDEECDKIAAQTIDRVAVAKGLAHGLELNTDISVSHTLRRELIRAGLAAAAGEPVAYLHYAKKKPELRDVSFSSRPTDLQKARGWETIPLCAAPIQPSV